MSRPKLLLDSNIWRSFVDEDSVESLVRTARAQCVDIIACPAVAYEALRGSDPRLRKTLIRAITRGAWVRPMPEAFQEVEELRREIQRVRPEWLTPAPDLRDWQRLKADWEHNWWRRARSTPDLEASYIAFLSGARLEAARVEAHTLRKQAQNAGFTFHNTRLDDAVASFGHPVDGWNGKPFEQWRAQSMMVWSNDFMDSPESTYSDWLGPWVDRTRIRRDPSSWIAFWTQDVSADKMPLQWLRWAFQTVQATRKTTRGTPVDNQISTYLPKSGCDFLITSDKAFGECLERVAPFSPVPLAMCHVVPVGKAAVARVLGLMREVGSSVPA